MKKRLFIIWTAILVLALSGCNRKIDTANELPSSSRISAADVTAEYLTRATTPSEILKSGAFSANRHFENTGDALLEGSDIKTTYAMNGDVCEINEIATYSDGYVSNSFFSTDSKDKNYYMSYPGGAESAPIDDDFTKEFTDYSIAGYLADSLELSEVSETDDTITARVINKSDAETLSNDTVTIDKTTGKITKIVATYPSAKSSGESTCTIDFDYSESIKIDYSAKLAVTGDTTSDNTTSDSTTTDSNSAGSDTSDEYTGVLDLNTEDINGNPVTNEIFKNAKLVLINFWEPWCGPCVKELPDLQKLYENYKDKGLVIIGAYKTFDMQSEAEDIISSNSITYPIVKNNAWLDSMEQDYVPATYIAGGDGNILSEEPLAGARSYEEWEELVKKYLDL